MRSDITNCRFKKFRSGLAAGAAILALSLCPLGASARQGQSQDAPPVMNQGAPPPNMQQQQAPITLQKPTIQQNGAPNGNAVERQWRKRTSGRDRQSLKMICM